MEAYHISGGRPLRGSIAIHGAKNGVLPILAATLAVGGRCTLTNCPEIRDVDTALQILGFSHVDDDPFLVQVLVDARMRRVQIVMIFRHR